MYIDFVACRTYQFSAVAVTCVTFYDRLCTDLSVVILVLHMLQIHRIECAVPKHLSGLQSDGAAVLTQPPEVLCVALHETPTSSSQSHSR